MKLRLVRDIVAPTYTMGMLYVDGAMECFTLEDQCRPAGEKVPGATAIPEGTYAVQITYSRRFQRDMPLLLDVPWFDGIRIHPGNTIDDTEGCILVGTGRAAAEVRNSRQAFKELYGKLQQALEDGQEVSIEITQGATP